MVAALHVLLHRFVVVSSRSPSVTSTATVVLARELSA